MKPCLFNTDMTKAILDGKKSETRRIAKVLCGYEERCDGALWKDLSFFISPATGLLYYGDNSRQVLIDGKPVKAPFKRGDVIYVRETWTTDIHGKYYYRADFDSDYLDPCETLSGGYPESCAFHPGCDGCEREPQRIHWHPSIHMPKEAARIFLRVTDVRVERLQEITDEGAKAEGANHNAGVYDKMFMSAIQRFKKIWDRTVKPADQSKYGWDANPYVWVICFERISDAEAKRHG